MRSRTFVISIGTSFTLVLPPNPNRVAVIFGTTSQAQIVSVTQDSVNNAQGGYLMNSAAPVLRFRYDDLGDNITLSWYANAGSTSNINVTELST